MHQRGVVAAGHPVTAQAGARILREGGNAVDAAIAAVLASFAAESPLTGLGAGGYMLVADGERRELLDFFVQVPGGSVTRTGELDPVPVYFTEAIPQVFNVGAPSCGVPGVVAGLAEALRRFGSAPLAALCEPAIEAARDGVEINAQQAYLAQILEPILCRQAEGRRIYSPGGRLLGAGERLRFPELADSLQLFGERGAEPFVTGDVAGAISEWVTEHGGTIGRDDMAGYAPILREPLGARFAGREVLTNPPPSSGGVLIAFALELLERLGRSGPEELVAVMDEAQAARDEAFIAGLAEDDFAARFLEPARLDRIAVRIAGRGAGERHEAGGGRVDRLGSTTHITAVDGQGRCASVTCSNGSGSGVIVPGTGVHLNNMLGEEDLNPLGFHRLEPGSRVPSMMAPTVIMREGMFEAGLGSAGSNRIRSAITQTIVRLVIDDLDADAAVRAPRLHTENETVHAEPGIDAEALGRIATAGAAIERWAEPNLFFGGVQCVALEQGSGGEPVLSAGGDPRRGGAVAWA